MVKSLEVLPGVLRNSGKRTFISGEQGTKAKFRGNMVTKTTENIRSKFSIFGEQGNKPCNLFLFLCGIFGDLTIWVQKGGQSLEESK